jgi:hypothetical protein
MILQNLPFAPLSSNPLHRLNASALTLTREPPHDPPQAKSELGAPPWTVAKALCFGAGNTLSYIALGTGLSLRRARSVQTPTKQVIQWPAISLSRCVPSLPQINEAPNLMQVYIGIKASALAKPQSIASVPGARIPPSPLF